MTDRVKYLVSTFLSEGLTIEENNELKGLLRDSDNRQYFKDCYLSWYVGFQIKDDKCSERAFQRMISKLELSRKKTDKPQKVVFFNALVVAASILAFFLGMASYQFMFLNKEPKDLYSNNKIIVPFGSKSQVELPDGTIVTLNAGSQLLYDTNFGKDRRVVWLEGEAYFKVAHNKSSTFIVNADNVMIKAIGTEFNVKAYSDEEFVQTTLVEGSVSIQPNFDEKKKEEIVLHPNQMLTIRKTVNVYSDSTNLYANKIVSSKLNPLNDNSNKDHFSKVSKENVKTILYTSWKDSRWVIEEESMEDLAQKLQRRYDVNIAIVDESLKAFKFSGILENETLEQVLEIMKNIAPIEYEINKKEVSLAINQKQRKAFEELMN